MQNSLMLVTHLCFVVFYSLQCCGGSLKHSLPVWWPVTVVVCCRLMLYGVVCTLAERNEAAETFFEAATNVEPKSIMAWTMLGE